jgi:hypothetical protein
MQCHLDATSRFGSNENIFPVCQSFETFHLVDSKCLQIKFITNKFFFTGRCHFQLSNICITKRFWLAGDDDYIRGATSINHQVALCANFKIYSRSAKGGEKGDPNRNPWLAKCTGSRNQWNIKAWILKMYSRSAKGGEKGDPNRNPWPAKMCCPIRKPYFYEKYILEI